MKNQPEGSCLVLNKSMYSSSLLRIIRILQGLKMLHGLTNLQTNPSVSYKKHTLQPDMLNGWVPKIPSIPLPLHYSRDLQRIKELVISQDMSVYEWNNIKYNTVKLHKSYNYKWEKRQKYDIKLGVLQDAVQKIGKPSQFEKFLSRTNLQNESQFRFNSDFQSGNLLLVIRINPFEYDCFLRSDSNTNGHTNWYFFSVQNLDRLGNVRINICNLKKVRNMYGKGMQPYVKVNAQSQWNQTGCQQVNFIERYCRYMKNQKTQFYTLNTILLPKIRKYTLLIVSLLHIWIQSTLPKPCRKPKC